MNWLLVVVWAYQGIPSVEIIEEYESMYDCCFELYEEQVKEKMQLVCVENDDG